MYTMDPAEDFLRGASVRNTFLEFARDEAEDPWMLEFNPRRQQTDSILQNTSLRNELEQSITSVLQSHLGLAGHRPDVPNRAAELKGANNAASGNEEKIGNSLKQLIATIHTDHPAQIPDVKDAGCYWSRQQTREEPEPMPAGASAEQEEFQYDFDNREEGENFDDAFNEDEEEENDTAGASTNVSPELLAIREIAANGGGLSGCTTVMVRHIPFKYTQRKLVREINSLGFLGNYDFLYLPMDPRSHANRGFAFLNLISAEVAEDFYKKVHGQHLRHFRSEKSIAVLPADLQGFEENALRYAATSTQRGKRTGHTKPIFFRPLPAHIVAKLGHVNPPAVAASSIANCNSAAPSRSSPIDEATFFVGQGAAFAGAFQQQVFSPTRTKPSPPTRTQTSQAPSTQPARAQSSPSPNVQLTAKFCVYCGRKRSADHSFCPYCGGHFQS